MSNRRRSNHSFSLEHTRRIPESERLQQETDLFTQRFEWEKKNNHIKFSSIRNLDDEIKRIKDNINRLRQEKEDGPHKKMNFQNKSLMRQLQAMMKKINQQIGQVKSLQTNIDAVREEKNRLLESIASCNQEIKANDEEVQRLNEQRLKVEQEQKEINDSIYQERQLNEKEKSQFYGRMISLNKNKGEKRGVSRAQSSAEFIQNETLAVLKNKVLKLIVNNKEKVKLIENYQKSMKSIDDAFNVIKEATGITDIEEIKNTFIKGQEQNYGLLTYVDVLSQEIQYLQSQNEELKRKNLEIQLDNEKKKEELSAMPEEQRHSIQVQKICQSKNAAAKEFSEMLSRLEPVLCQCLDSLSKSPFGDKKFNPDGFSLITGNANEYFSAIDETLPSLLLHVARENGKDNALKQLMALEDLPKTESKRSYASYVPSGQEDVPKGELLDFKKLREMAQVQLKKRDIKPKK